MSGAALLFPFLFQSYLLVHSPFPPLPPGISGCSAPGALIYLVLHFLFELSSLSWDSYRLHSCAGNRCFLHNLLPYTLQHLKPLVKHCLHYHRWSSMGIIKSSERWQGECESLLDSTDVEVQSVCWLWDTFAVLLFLFKLKEKPAKVDLSYRTPPPNTLWGIEWLDTQAFVVSLLSSVPLIGNYSACASFDLARRCLLMSEAAKLKRYSECSPMIISWLFNCCFLPHQKKGT